MPFFPDLPFPKAQGSTIRSKDWNDLVTEVKRLDEAKVNRAGADTLTGPLSVTGGEWDLTSSEGDFKIGNAATRLKVGVALSGGNAGDVRLRAQGGTNRLLLGGGTNDVLAITPDSVGIGTPIPTERLEVAGNLKLKGSITLDSGAARTFRIAHDPTGENVQFVLDNGKGVFLDRTGTLGQISDASLKENVAGLSGVLERIVQLRPVSFDWKGLGLKGLGFVAQEVEPVFPELVSEHTGPDGKPLKGLSYATFGVLAIGALQEMKRHYDARFEVLETQLRALTSRS